ncbi:TPA: VTT domain-containing protein [Streptococcus agalactiae]
MFLIDFILHIDTHIYAMANTVGNWTYLLLFLVIFVETGAVIFPFLPGDSCNFLIGRTFGYRFIKHPFFRRFIKEKNIRDAELYFEKKGTAAIILGRYIPIIRTFVPFVAGISQLPPKVFIKRAFIAALSWSVIATGSGFLFGNIPFVKQHFSLIILGIVFVTLIPVLISGVKSYRNTK